MFENLLSGAFFRQLTENAYLWFDPEALTELAWRLTLALVVALTAVVAYRLGLRLVIRLFAGGEEGAVKGKYLSEELNRTLKLGLIALVRYGIIVLVAVLILEIFQVNVFGADQLRVLGITLMKIIGIFILAQVALGLGNTIIERLFISGEKEHLFNKKRAKTLSGLLKSILLYGVYFVAGVMVLDTFGVRTGSILAGAGIIGLAVGFGAQNLVRDVITGFFIIFEDQYGVGDFVTLAGVSGTVEDLGLRTTKIKEWTGQLHIIPNGEVGRVTNFNKGCMAAVVLVSIAYEEDIDQAMAVLTGAGAQARAELPQIVENPVVQGVVELADSGVVLRVLAFTLPGEQWAMERELRKRFKYALDRAGIEIPYPRRVIINQRSPVNDG